MKIPFLMNVETPILYSQSMYYSYIYTVHQPMVLQGLLNPNRYKC